MPIAFLNIAMKALTEVVARSPATCCTVAPADSHCTARRSGAAAGASGQKDMPVSACTSRASVRSLSRGARPLRDRRAVRGIVHQRLDQGGAAAARQHTGRCIVSAGMRTSWSSTTAAQAPGLGRVALPAHAAARRCGISSRSSGADAHRGAARGHGRGTRRHEQEADVGVGRDPVRMRHAARIQRPLHGSAPSTRHRALRSSSRARSTSTSWPCG